jgi:tetratricopeptide (TPR) repeat protein
MGGINVSQIDQLTTDVVFGAAVGGANQAAPPVIPSALLNVTPTDVVAARKLNVQGEAAYRGGDLASAIRLFQSAVAIDDTYGHAYSNLGLVFQKSGRVAEALWANRKAIALATGPAGSTTRANTHFNNGRIYEDAGQWVDAAREYTLAENERDNPIYGKSIQRMRDHGAN